MSVINHINQSMQIMTLIGTLSLKSIIKLEVVKVTLTMETAFKRVSWCESVIWNWKKNNFDKMSSRVRVEFCILWLTDIDKLNNYFIGYLGVLGYQKFTVDISHILKISNFCAYNVCKFINEVLLGNLAVKFSIEFKLS